MSNFCKKWLAGEADDDDMDDAIDEWHEGAGEGLQLHEYLGMTWSQYKDWIEERSGLAEILGKPKKKTAAKSRRSKARPFSRRTSSSNTAPAGASNKKVHVNS